MKQSEKTHCPQGHPYSEENTYFTSQGRKCRTCHAIRQRGRKDKNRTLDRARYAANPELYKARVSDYMRRRMYGLGTADVYVMVLKQNGCAICGAQSPGGRGWHVDHDHLCCPGQYTCGACVRGVLCDGCNKGLGSFKDDPARLVRAYWYLLERSMQMMPTVKAVGEEADQ